MVYSPVCGADWENLWKRLMKQGCKGVEIVSEGACATESCICTEEYDPVGGADGKPMETIVKQAAKGWKSFQKERVK